MEKIRSKSRKYTEVTLFDQKYDIPSQLPILPLKVSVIFPGLITPISARRESTICLIDEAVSSRQLVGIFTQSNAEVEYPKRKDLYPVGVVAHILKSLKTPEGYRNILVQGITRISLKRITQRKSFLRGKIEVLSEKVESSVEMQALTRALLNQFQKIVALNPRLSEQLSILAVNLESPGMLADLVASNLDIETFQKQKIMAQTDIKKRVEIVKNELSREIEVLELENKIHSQVREEWDQQHKEFYLRKQLEAIRRELGEGGDPSSEIQELHEKIAEKNLPEKALAEAKKELKKLSHMHPSSPESNVSRSYLEWVIDMPWNTYSQDRLDLSYARKILHRDHYNLEKVKDRILEYLAVCLLRKEVKGPILCFVGPPGVGKTSLGRSIAEAMGRKFVRLSLGGVRDEAEIRGHRRTYIGAMPGRIIQEIRRSGTSNPVFMLDEVDKLGRDFRGDPSSALLEVLDREQNHSFHDHYLNIPFDLSKAMFIATANILDPIPAALKDRMEVLRIPGYTLEEKVKIAEKFLVPKQISENGMGGQKLSFTNRALQTLIEGYTREAGLRSLEREIGNVMRKIACEIVQKKKRKPGRIGVEKVRQFLGPPLFQKDLKNRITRPGIGIGLAWTQAGGEIMFIEGMSMKGKGKLSLTGSLGDVMKESAQAALSYIRAHATDIGIDEKCFEDMDIHVHLPEGAIPKDGPSAGITITAVLASLLSHKTMPADLAMTGEITLTGKILPIGGVKEKILAAKQAGIKRVILPIANKYQWEDLSAETKKDVQVIMVNTMEEVLLNCLGTMS